jgi:hypothetical protein
MIYQLLFTTLLTGSFIMATAQENAKPEDTEVWGPVPAIVTPGTTGSDAPSDAIVLFDGKNLDQWVTTDDKSPAEWIVDGGILTVKKGTGNIETKQVFTNYQLHVEWRIPANITGSGQARGNSGVFLASTGKGDDGYELQILDSYKNTTYVNGQAGSIYKQFSPLVNISKKPGEWQVYDVIWTAPVFNEKGDLKSPARITVLLNGVLIQNNVELLGPTRYIGKPLYGDKSEPVSFRNIWVRRL